MKLNPLDTVFICQEGYGHDELHKNYILIESEGEFVGVKLENENDLNMFIDAIKQVYYNLK